MVKREDGPASEKVALGQLSLGWRSPCGLAHSKAAPGVNYALSAGNKLLTNWLLPELLEDIFLRKKKKKKTLW